MIAFKCGLCGAGLKVDDAKVGRKGHCPKCGSVVVVPSAAAQAEQPNPFAKAVERDLHSTSQRPPAPTVASARPAIGGPTCPSCMQELGAGAKICTGCGIKIPSGRPVVLSRGLDEDRLAGRTESVLRPLSWLIPFGIFPIASEAHGRSKPYVTWAIAAVTVVVSIWFLAMELTDSTQMRWMKNLMLWAGDAKPDAAHIIAYYEQTSYGDPRAFMDKLEELADAETEGEDPDQLTEQDEERLVVAAMEALPPEQRSLGEHRFSQLITHAFLHADLLHLAGNMLFLLVLGSRVNAAIGNLATLVLYPILAMLAGAVYSVMSAASMPGAMLGASGAVMGLAGAYFVLFPLQRLHMAAWWRWGLGLRFRLSWKTFTTYGFIVVGVYIGLDILYTALQLETGTAHWAHIGGFVAGAVAAVALLVLRFVHSGSDLLSLIFGKYAWVPIGAPAGRVSAGSAAAWPDARRDAGR